MATGEPQDVAASEAGELNGTPSPSQAARGMKSRMKAAWAWPPHAHLRDNAHEVLLITTLGLGFFLRVNSWLGHHISFWYDESMWAMRLLHLSLLDLSIRPIGFMWLTRLLVHAFGATEVWFRFLPAVGAIGSLLLMPYVASQLLRSRWLQLLLVFLFAINPALIDYANEFKPYSLEVLIHLVPVALYLRFKQTGHRAWFFALLGSLPLGFLLAYNLTFAFPGVLLLCLFAAWRSKDRNRLIAATLLSGVACVGTVAVVYKLALSHINREEKTENYWGDKYHVFYERSSDQGRVDWTLQKFDDMTSFIGIRRVLWSQFGGLDEQRARELGSADRAFWVAMSFVGMISLWLRRRDLLWVLLAPLLVMTLGNLFGKWPLGAFRTNVFVCAYTLPLAVLGLQHLASTWRRSAVLGGFVLGLTVLPGFMYGFDWHGHKRLFTRDHYQREILDKLYAYRKQQLATDPKQPPITLLLEPHTYSPYSYYLHDHPKFSEQYRAFFDANFVAKKVNPGALVTGLRKALLKEKHGMWIVTSSRSDLDKVERAAQRDAEVVIRERIADQHVLMFLKPKTD